MIRKIIWIGIGLFALSACENDPADIERLMENLKVEVETAKGVEILYSDSAQLKVRIKSPTMLRNVNKTDPYQEFPDGLHVDFFDEGQIVSSVLTSKYGIRYENKGTVIVRDSVVWRSIEGEKIETEELIWKEKEEMIYSNKFVVITRPDEIIYGHGFEANQDFSYSKIHAIEGRLKVQEPAEE